MYWHRHDDFENFLMYILKVERFYPPMGGVSTQFRKFFEIKITIFMNKRYFFRVFFFRNRHIEVLRRRNPILTTDSKRAHSKIIGYPFQDELLMIQSFFTRFEIPKKIMDFWALMG